MEGLPLFSTQSVRRFIVCAIFMCNERRLWIRQCLSPRAMKRSMHRGHLLRASVLLRIWSQQGVVVGGREAHRGPGQAAGGSSWWPGCAGQISRSQSLAQRPGSRRRQSRSQLRRCLVWNHTFNHYRNALGGKAQVNAFGIGIMEGRRFSTKTNTSGLCKSW